MKKIFFVFLVAIASIACSSNLDEPDTTIIETPLETEGKSSFRIDLKEITAKNTLGSSQKKLEPAFALLSINDKNDNSVLTREKLSLTKMENSYVTTEFALEAGTYSLIEFIVIDADDVVISLSPKENSVLAQFTNKSLPYEFEVLADETKETVTENISAAGYSSDDFGYTELSLTFPENTDFFSMTIDDSNVLTSKMLNLKSITGSTYVVDWGDGVLEEYVSTVSDSGIENKVSHTYSQKGIYTVTISGAVEAIELLEFNSEDQENGFQSNITAINIDKLALLKSCQVYGGKLTTLNTSQNVALESLGLGYNQITSLDFTNNPNLKTAWLRYNQLTELDVSQNPNLDFLWVEGNQISNLDLSNNSKLKVLLARENNLAAIDFSNTAELERFDLSNNGIASIDISANPLLTEINLGANQLSSIDVSSNANLIRIDLYTNQISAIDLSANVNLRDLYIDNNQLTEIDLSSNPLMERLVIENNNLGALDTVENPKIFDLQIGGNQFDGAQLDQIISQIYDQAVQNSVMNGYMDYKNNPGTNAIDNTTIAKLNDLVVNYDWSFNNN